MSDSRGPITFLRLDFILIFCVLTLMALGVAFIYSSGVNSAGEQTSNEWVKQLVWSGIGLALMILFALLDYRNWRRIILPVYLGLLIVLLGVLVFGRYVKGARSWIGIGGVGGQPSEFGKIVVILVLASWFEDHSKGSSNLRTWLFAIVITALPVGLVLLQPDLGTGIVYIPILLAVSFVAGTDFKYWFFPVGVGVLVLLGILGYAWSEHILSNPLNFFRLFSEINLLRIGLAAGFGMSVLCIVGWFFFRTRLLVILSYLFSLMTISFGGIGAGIRVLRGYQMMRLVVFLDPQIDPRGAGWHILQSITAVGSGGVLGKGYLQGTQSHYQYLPEQSTDFIFSILSEEMGFLGGVLVFVLFILIIVRSLYIGLTSQDRFGTYIAVGIAAMMSFHVIQNIGMAMGVMPITGIPLFFLSYGGSSLLTALISVGLLLSIHYRRNK